MVWIEPLELKTWFVNVFAGSPEIFLVVSLIALTSLAAYLRINYLVTMLLTFIFIVLFSSEVSMPLILTMIFLGLFMFIIHFIKVFISNQ